MYSLIQRELHGQNGRGSPRPNGNGNGNGSRASHSSSNGEQPVVVPELFTDPGYNLLGTSVLSTSNCGNPALRLFGFGPVTPEGYGIGA
jgi:carnitine O-acetyltransferase